MSRSQQLVVKTQQDEASGSWAAWVVREEGETGPWYVAEGSSEEGAIGTLLQMIGEYAERQGWEEYAVRINDGVKNFVLERTSEWGIRFRASSNDGAETSGEAQLVEETK